MAFGRTSNNQPLTSAVLAGYIKIPPGGVDGQALVKDSTNTGYGVRWATITGGGGGGGTGVVFTDNPDGTWTATGMTDNPDGTWTAALTDNPDGTWTG